MVQLTERLFAAAKQDGDFKGETLHPAGAWADYWESRYISQFDTFYNGLNSTKGGQGSGWLVAVREAKANGPATEATLRHVAQRHELGHLD